MGLAPMAEHRNIKLNLNEIIDILAQKPRKTEFIL